MKLKKKWLSYHSPTRNPIEAKKATMPTMVEKWQALESMLRTHTSCPRFCIKNHPEDEMQPKTIMEKNCKRKMLKSINNLVKLTIIQLSSSNFTTFFEICFKYYNLLHSFQNSKFNNNESNVKFKNLVNLFLESVHCILITFLPPHLFAYFQY